MSTRRFLVHQWRDAAECEGEDVWRIIDSNNLVVAGYADTERRASLIADALEHLSFDATVDEFEAFAA